MYVLDGLQQQHIFVQFFGIGQFVVHAVCLHFIVFFGDKTKVNELRNENICYNKAFADWPERDSCVNNKVNFLYIR